MESKEPKHRDWIKLWIRESLLGTIREDMTAEERSVWYDFLLLAGNCRAAGVIAANENTAMPVKRIAGILNVSEALINRCIKKFESSGRIERDLTGVIRIKNWEKYQYSDYDRVKQWRKAHKEESQKKSDDESSEETDDSEKRKQSDDESTSSAPRNNIAPISVFKGKRPIIRAKDGAQKGK